MASIGVVGEFGPENPGELVLVRVFSLVSCAHTILLYIIYKTYVSCEVDRLNTSKLGGFLAM